MLRGPTGGMLACLLLAALLGGIAAADPGGDPNDDASDVALGLTGAQGAEPGPHTEADCQVLMEVAGSPEEEGARGLARAIYVVLGNCGENLKAPGLLVALERLTSNFRRHMEPEAAQQGARAGDRRNHGKAGGAMKPQPPSSPGRSGRAPGQAAGPSAGIPNGS